MSTHVILPSKPLPSPAGTSEAAPSPLTQPPPPVNSHDPTTITRDTDQFGTVLFVNIPGYGRYTPAQLIACLEAQEALGAARADAAALEVRVQELESTIKLMRVFHRQQLDVLQNMAIALDPPSLVEAFAELRAVVGGAYDGVDVEAYVRELRED